VDQLTAITPRLRDYAVVMGANPQTSSYLPSGADTDLFFYQEKDPDLMSKYNIAPEDLVMLFAGTIYNFSGLDKIISSLPKTLKKIPYLKLLIVGAGEQENQLKALVQELSLEISVIFTGFISYPELPRHVNLADICINPFEINKITNIIFPGKIYQYLACEKPVIATKLQGMLDVFPADDRNSGIHYYDTVDEFFTLVGSIGRCRVKDPNPSLQEITVTLEEKLKKLCSLKKGVPA
jgi:glycosyltransferase involved in cell wall biosynthesis